MKAIWNSKYDSKEYQYGLEPNEFLKKTLTQMAVGRLLVPAAGEGRDAVFAAQVAWEVHAFDSSATAQGKANKLAGERSVNLHYECIDAASVRYPLESFDAIALIYFHQMPEERRKFHQQCIKWLKPGGKIILEGFHKNQLGQKSGGPKEWDMLFDEEELNQDFTGLHIEYLEEKECILNEGPLHQGKAYVIDLVATKPLS
ncbi:class I SAM-dependent methyltransferase [Cytophagaceae bacterium 50C-KIRBA]|uniref:Class I SAM-dependent methyltransferase n=1 Tax=Aquirufa beregesia TaxID=2516556 RepID=A0ABX0F2S2_9BACT|nr:class I SAM-dependent methyltransferase [Aquirufa beregesia]NGZ45329.1 class I SAM-dependent methyltransferase [Aquirufa beregesia]